MTEPKTDKRMQIIEGAITVLSEKNYENMKTAVVASQAGIAEGTIYLYFASKRDLFIETLKVVSKRLGDYFLKNISEQNDLKTNLMVLAESFFIRSDEVNTLYRILYKAFSEVEDAEIRTELSELYEQGYDAIKRIITWEVDKRKRGYLSSQIEIAFMMIWGMGDMMWKREMISGRPASAREDLENMLDLLMKLFDV